MQNNYLDSEVSVATVTKEAVIEPGGYGWVEFYDEESPTEDLDLRGI